MRRRPPGSTRTYTPFPYPTRFRSGDSFGVDVAAADAYGERRDGLTQRVPKKHFKEQKLAPGMQVVLNTNFGPRAVTIQKVGMSVVDVDLNHPMAGKDLHFDIDRSEERRIGKEGGRMSKSRLTAAN